MKLYQWDSGGILTLTFPAPTEPVSVNATAGMHFARARRLTSPWRDMAVLVTRQAIQRGHVPEPVTIAVGLPFRTRRRRDPHNYTGTTVKALVDGLVRGGLIPDDTPEWATIQDPAILIQPDRSQPLLATVTVTPRSHPCPPPPP